MKNYNNITNIISILNAGGIILYPTDTIWGIGCDAHNPIAVSKIYNIKKRQDSKALISLVANKEQLLKYSSIIPKEALNNKPTTIIYHNPLKLANNLLAKDGSAGIRIVQDKFCKNLISNFGKAIVATSANISGEKHPKIFSEINSEITKNVDYIVDLRKDEIMNIPSQILNITPTGQIKRIR